MSWKQWKRTGQILQSVAGLLSIGTVVWAAVEGVSLPAMPGWLALTSGIVILLSGIAIGRRLPRRAAIESANTIHVFDYRDFGDPVETHGWTLHGADSATGCVEVGSDAAFGMVARIDLPPGAALDRVLSDQCRSAAVLEFVGEPGAIYASVTIRSKTAPRSRTVWLRFMRGDGPPTPYEDGTQEWSFHIQPASQQQRWPVYRLDLAGSVRESFGRNGGWTLAEVVALRFRGRSVVAQIGLLKDRSSAPN